MWTSSSPDLLFPILPAGSVSLPAYGVSFNLHCLILAVNKISCRCSRYLQWPPRLWLLELYLDDAERWKFSYTCCFLCFNSSPPHGRRVTDGGSPAYGNRVEFARLGSVVK